MLFAVQLMQAYEKFARRRGWSWEALELSTVSEGVRHATISVSGPNCYSTLRFEAGTHRLAPVDIRREADKAKLRTPVTTVNIVVMPELENVSSKSKAGSAKSFERVGRSGPEGFESSPRVWPRITRIPHLAVGRNGGTDHQAKAPRRERGPSNCEAHRRERSGEQEIAASSDGQSGDSESGLQTCSRALQWRLVRLGNIPSKSESDEQAGFP
jgi:hypothetical protein